MQTHSSGFFSYLVMDPESHDSAVRSPWSCSYLLLLASVPVICLYFFTLAMFTPLQQALWVHIFALTLPVICILIASLVSYWMPTVRTYMCISMVCACTISLNIEAVVNNYSGDLW